MGLRPEEVGPVPDETARIAQAAFSIGSTDRQMRDILGAIYDDARFARLFAARRRPVESAWRLALVTVMQFAEGLADQQAAEAVRARIDRTDALGLELGDPGSASSVLAAFRARLVSGSVEHVLLDAFLDTCRTRGYLRARGRQRTDASHVLAAMRVPNRLEQVAETLRAALEALAAPRGGCGR